jgi:hypothetical protein
MLFYICTVLGLSTFRFRLGAKLNKYRTGAIQIKRDTPSEGSFGNENLIFLNGAVFEK